eukprot:CAMPEP_0181120338 /NCGR_PEP_ID=MMETSP1071-20121207/24103_1 /TAXON_ID=35127 /ORGANISM="Thalassiosira sp., Strain NH16" /LENGTH=170 /DNA_ID=CAMNT_0023204987 /DNA_START=83 /DNA_END=592 /DNA_ORIENTATION=+
MSDNDSPLSLNDPVSVDNQTGSGPVLEGIVAHLGPVKFAPGLDWIGIRLTGSSAGRGKNDGSVKGARYFDAGGGGSSADDKNGMFARRANVRRRRLSKLEELRLRRELGENKTRSRSSSSAGGGAVAAAAGGGGRRSSGAATAPPARTMASKTPPKNTDAAAGGGSSKLE